MDLPKKKKWDALSKYLDGPVNYIWIGTVDEFGDIQAERVAQYLEAIYISHFDVGLEKGTRWRFREGTNTIFWWDDKPTKVQKEAVSYYLEKRRFYPSHNHLIGDREWPTAHARNEKIPSKYQYKTIGDSTKFDTLVSKLLNETLGFGGNIARGINRTKNLHQIPDKHRVKPFKKNYVPKSKTTKPTVNNAKKADRVLRRVTSAEVSDMSKKYGFKIPGQGEPSKKLGSTGIAVKYSGPNNYFITKR